MADEPPNLTIAAKNTDEDMARERCLWHIDHYTRELAANMMRIIRWAGQPHQDPR